MDVLARVCLAHSSSTGGAVGRKGGFNPRGLSTLHPKGWDDRGVGAGGLGSCSHVGLGLGQLWLWVPPRVPWVWGVFADFSPQPLGTQPGPTKYKPKKHKQMIT